MKIFHTADWHLGKLVQGVYMTEDQEFVLKQFIDIAAEEKPDVIIIAGDIYDRAVPPTDAVQLLDRVLGKIVNELRIPVIAIAGNHDSPSRLHFGSSLMNQNGLHIIGRLQENQGPIILEDAYGEVHFHPIPYADPSIVRHVFAETEIKNHDEAQKVIIDRLEEKFDPKARHVAIGHAFVTPKGEQEDNTSESERPLSIGGSEFVNADHYQPFHYTALGHLHQAHQVKTERIQYAGSLLKYSISEEHHKKGFLVVDLDGQGDLSIEKRLLTPRRDLRRVEGHIDELLNREINEDYVFVKLRDETPVLSPMERIRSVFPNAMHVEREFYGTQLAQGKESGDGLTRQKMTDIELFRAFYMEVKGEKPNEKAEAIFIDALEEITKQEQ